jgi:NodT family efflux transporter outer membrane factor (OMF) lipoprotein
MHTRAATKHWLATRAFVGLCFMAAATAGLGGCTTGVRQYVHNGFKVGPNYQAPPAPLPQRWIDQADAHVHHGNPNLATWWDVFDDPVLNALVHQAYTGNLSLRAAGMQILEAKELRFIAASELLPQSQSYNFQYTHGQVAGNGTSSRFFNNVLTGFNLSWELDVWGLFRRSLEVADANLDQSVQNYDEMVVMLLANVATQYVEIRTLQRRLELARQNVDLQQPLVDQYRKRYKVQMANSYLGYFQLKSNLDNTKALIPQLETSLRQANNQLCVLLGIPVRDLLPELGAGQVPDPEDPTQMIVHIPSPRDESVVLDIPGKALLQRPDVAAAESQVRNQSAQIGVTEAALYPHISVNGNIGLSAATLGALFNSQSWVGSIGPSLQWNILNYGRLLAAVREKNFEFQQAVATYQNTVLTANQDAENALVAYLQSLEEAKDLQDSAIAAAKSHTYLLKQYNQGAGGTDTGTFINQLFTTINFQVAQQDSAAQAEGNIALNLILLYRALGGGWQIRLNGNPHLAPPPGPNDISAPEILPPSNPPAGPEVLPPPRRAELGIPRNGR